MASSRPAPVTMPRTLRRWSFLKKSPGHLGSDPGGPPEGHPDRAVVAGRGPCRPEEQDRPALGPTGHPAPRPARSADEFGLHLRSDLPPGGQGRSLGAAPMRHAGHEPALGGSRTSRGSRSPWGPADGPGRMAPRQGARRARQSHAGAAASPSARIEPGREYLAVSARQLVVEPRVRLLPRHRRSLLRRLEPPHRPALAHHVHRPPRLGQCIQCMMISAGWYKPPAATDPKTSTRFQKGKSGNPRGRAVGSKNSVTRMVESLLDSQAKGVAQAAVALALTGDPSAIKLILDRVSPVRKGR